MPGARRPIWSVLDVRLPGMDGLSADATAAQCARAGTDRRNHGVRQSGRCRERHAKRRVRLSDRSRSIWSRRPASSTARRRIAAITKNKAAAERRQRCTPSCWDPARDAGGLQTDCGSSPIGRFGPDHRRERHRQGTRSPGDPPPFVPRRRAVCADSFGITQSHTGRE